MFRRAVVVVEGEAVVCWVLERPRVLVRDAQLVDWASGTWKASDNWKASAAVQLLCDWEVSVLVPNRVQRRYRSKSLTNALGHVPVLVLPAKSSRVTSPGRAGLPPSIVIAASVGILNATASGW